METWGWRSCHGNAKSHLHLQAFVVEYLLCARTPEQRTGGKITNSNMVNSDPVINNFIKYKWSKHINEKTRIVRLDHEARHHYMWSIRNPLYMLDRIKVKRMGKICHANTKH